MREPVDIDIGETSVSSKIYSFQRNPQTYRRMVRESRSCHPFGQMATLDASIKVVLHHGVGTNTYQMSLFVGIPRKSVCEHAQFFWMPREGSLDPIALTGLSLKRVKEGRHQECDVGEWGPISFGTVESRWDTRDKYFSLRGNWSFSFDLLMVSVLSLTASLLFPAKA